MIPIELELHNFLAYRDPGPLHFEGIHVACLVGPNGAGKSSLLDALTWCLWGKARVNSPDELIHQGMSEMRVTLTFNQGDNCFRVVRQRKADKRGTSLLELQASDPTSGTWRGISEKTIRATQQKIEALLRLDYDTFINSAFLVQGKADEFTTKTPGQRKEVLANILGLSRWEAFERRAKDRVAETKDSIHRLDGRLEEIDRELLNRETYEADMIAAESVAKEAAEKLAAGERQWSDLERARNDLVASQRQIDDLTRRISSSERDLTEAEREYADTLKQANQDALETSAREVRTALAELTPIQTRFVEATNERAAHAEEIARLDGINQALGPETEPIKERVATLETTTEPICPTCGQELTEDHRIALVAELEAEIEARREQYRANRTRIDELQDLVTMLDVELASLNHKLEERSILEKRAGELEVALEHAAAAALRAEDLKGKIDRWKRDLKSDQGARQKLERKADECERRLRAETLTQDDVDQLRLEKRMADERVGGARQKVAALDSFARQRQERIAERERLTEDRSLYEDLQKAFGKRGVPAMIIETAVPELERSANELLQPMTDGRMKVHIETQRTTKAGDLREALDIKIYDGKESRAYELYSGGEAFRINFAIRIALSRLLAHRAGAQLRSLFIDEGFGTQDTRGREHLVSAINSIQKDFDLILVITHIDELKDAFPARIEVSKEPGGSRFQLT
jgi:exonuclease SbcC